MKHIYLYFLFASNVVLGMEVAAHRGSPGYLPEHTLEGYAMAHAFNVDYIEPDLVMTKDNHIIILHDHHLDTTSNVAQLYPKRKRKDGRYYAIDFTLQEIKSLSINERFDPRSKGRIFKDRYAKETPSFIIPTFEEFINLVQDLNRSRGKNIGIIPEIKAPEFHLKEGKDITKAVIKILRKYGYEKSQKAIIQCFWPATLKRLKKEFKTTIPLLQLVAKNSWGESSFDYEYFHTEKGIKEVEKYAKIISYSIDELINNNDQSKITKLVKRSKLKLYGYTFRREYLPKDFSEKKFTNFLKNKIKLDGIFSDFPDTTMKFK